MKRLAPLGLLLAAGCTFEDGTGFATLEGASLAVKLEPGAARDLGNQTVLSDLGYEVHLETATLGVGALRLSELGGTSGQPVVFDPANPPPGYGACHAGHCHADDGRLVSYEDIQRELAGDGATLTPIVSLPADTLLDLWSAEPRALGEPRPSAELPRAELSVLSIELTSIELSGDVRASGSTLTPRPFSIALPLHAAFEHAIDLSIDRDEPGAITIETRVTASARLIDGMDWNAIADAGSIDDPEAPAALALIESLLESDVVFEVR